MFKTFCKHKNYRIIECKKNEKTYKCQCIKCGTQFDLSKAVDEMYEINQIVRLY